MVNVQISPQSIAVVTVADAVGAEERGVGAMVMLVAVGLRWFVGAVVLL